VRAENSYLPQTAAEESPYLTEIREFATAFRGGPLPRVSLEDGVIAVALAQAARTSIATGTPVDFALSAIIDLERIAR
jgi:myo-inositol 2-dehydrogenase/D-chiro-inositol 1-dehydrogenase